MSCARYEVQRRAGNRLLKTFADPEGDHAVVLAPDDRRGNVDVRELFAEHACIAGRERANVRHERIAAIGAHEGTQIEVERMRGARGITEATPELATQHGGE